MNMVESKTKIPAILDTDIGTDIDDSWALAMLLRSPELDVRLITTCTDNTVERAKLAAKMLEIERRTDIPLGIGVKGNDDHISISPWVTNYDLNTYPGVLHRDGVDAMIDVIMSSDEKVTLICIGPLTNIAEALSREPEIAKRTRIAGMLGNIYRKHENPDTGNDDYNVYRDIPASQKVFTADWDMVITPLDTCAMVRLEGEKYREVLASTDPLVGAVIEQYRIWPHGQPDERSSILYDTVAVYLAFADDLLVMRELGICVTDDGFTRPNDAAKMVNCAIEWRDLPAFEDFLVKRLAKTRE